MTKGITTIRNPKFPFQDEKCPYKFYGEAILVSQGAIEDLFDGNL